MANTVRILITAKDEISGQLDKIRDKASLLSKTDIGKGMAMGVGIAGFNALKGAAMGALDAVTGYAAGSVAAFREEEVGISRLGASLRANVKDWDGNTDAIEKHIGAMVKSTGFSDGEMRDSLARLVAVTKDVDQAFAIQATAMDLARFKGISLADASDALIKVEAGQYRALKGLGIVLRDGATQTEALAAVQKVAGGQMAAYADTAAAKTEILNNRLGDLQEELGARVSPALSTATENVLGFMDAVDSDAPLTFLDRLKGLGDMANMINPLMWSTNIATDELAKTQKRAADEVAAAAAKDAKAWDTIAEGGAALREVSSAAGTARTRINKMTQPVLDLADAYKDLDRWASEAAETLLQNDPKQLQLAYEGSTLALRDEKAELKDVQAEIEKRHKKGLNATREQRIDENRLKQSIEDTKDETVALGLKLVATGKMTYDDLRKELGKLGIVLDHDADEAARLKANLWKAADAAAAYDSTGRGDRGKYGNRATGGPIAPYGTSWVGENGPELIRTGSAGAMVYASPGSLGSAGGSTALTINVSTPVMTPGAAQALADAIGPTITRWQQARGV